MLLLDPVLVVSPSLLYQISERLFNRPALTVLPVLIPCCLLSLPVIVSVVSGCSVERLIVVSCGDDCASQLLGGLSSLPEVARIFRLHLRYRFISVGALVLRIRLVNTCAALSPVPWDDEEWSHEL